VRHRRRRCRRRHSSIKRDQRGKTMPPAIYYRGVCREKDLEFLRLPHTYFLSLSLIPALIFSYYPFIVHGIYVFVKKSAMGVVYKKKELEKRGILVTDLTNNTSIASGEKNEFFRIILNRK